MSSSSLLSWSLADRLRELAERGLDHALVRHVAHDDVLGRRPVGPEDRNPVIQIVKRCRLRTDQLVVVAFKRDLVRHVLKESGPKLVSTRPMNQPIEQQESVIGSGAAIMTSTGS